MRRTSFILLASFALMSPIWAGGSTAPPAKQAYDAASPSLLNAQAKSTAIIPFSGYSDIELLPSAQPHGMIASGFENTLWVAANTLGSLVRIDRTTLEARYFPLGTGARPVAVVEMRDQSIVAIDKGLNVIHRLQPSTGEITRIALPPGTPFLDLASAGIDLEGRLWFAGATGWLGSYDPASGATEVSSHDDLGGLSLGAMEPGGGIWFVAGKSSRMIHIDPQKSRFDSMSLPKELRGARGTAAGLKGEVWIAFGKSRVLARYSGRGTWLTIPLPWPDAIPNAILARQDDTIVFADAGRRKLTRYFPLSNTFEDVGDLGDGGAIKAIVDLGTSIAVADSGADRIRIFTQDPQVPTQ